MEQVTGFMLKHCSKKKCLAFEFQSALIQVVEYHAQTASLNVDKGAGELEQAKNYKIKATKVNK